MNRADFESIVEEYGAKLYRYLFRFLNNKDDAEDVLQSLFMAFYSNMDNVDPQRYAAYLFRTAHNQAINYKKKRNRFIPLSDSIKEKQHSIYDIDLVAEKKADQIRTALAKLKTQEVLAIELQFFQKKGYREIAEIMGLTPKAVDSMLVRAKRKLRKYLQDFR